MLQVADVAIADDDVRVAGEERRDEAGDVAAGVLVVRVGVDDDVGAVAEAGVDAGGERRREPFPAAEADDVMDAVRARDLGRLVRRTRRR